MDNPKINRLKIGQCAGMTGIAVNIVLFTGKIFAGIISGSVSVIADAINNLSDAGSSIFVLIGYHMSAKPPDREHPYGHARMEYLSGLFISIIITVLGFQLLTESGNKLLSGESVAVFSPLTVVIMAASMAFKTGLAIFYKILAKKIDSQVLRASAVDSIGDICATGAVILGMLLTPYTGPRTDAVLGCLIAAYIITLGLKLIKEAANTLIGTPPDKRFVNDIADKIKSYDGVIGIHDLVVHSYGADRYFVSVHVEVDSKADMMCSHDLVDNIENDLNEEGIRLVIHMDPVQYADPKVKELKEIVDGIVQGIAKGKGSVSTHDFRVVFGVTHTNLIFDLAVEEGFPMTDREICDAVKIGIKEVRPDYKIVLTVDRGYRSCRYN